MTASIRSWAAPLPLDGFQLDVRIKQITLRQLLLHAGGFDARKGGDYMHMARKIAKQTGHSLPIPDDWLIRYAFSRPLAFAPGAEEHYSNFGFFLCSEVIQRASGQTYEQYVRRRVLGLAGIEDMERERLGRHYAANEARRYGRDALKEFPGGRNPIGPPAGSWIGSAVNMARFLTALDGSRGAPLLTPRVYREMLAPPPAPLRPRNNGAHFGLGWDVVLPGRDGPRFSKNGGVPGIHAYIEHLPNGVDWVVLLNGGERAAGKPSPLNFCTQRPSQGDRPRQTLAAARPLPGAFPVRPFRRGFACRKGRKRVGCAKVPLSLRERVGVRGTRWRLCRSDCQWRMRP